MRIVFLTNTFTRTAVPYIEKLVEGKKEIVGIFLIRQEAKYGRNVSKILRLSRKYGLGILLKRAKSGFYLRFRYLVLGKLKMRENTKGREHLSVEESSLDYSLPLFILDSMNDKEAKETVKRLNPGIIFVSTLNQILEKEVIEIPQYGCINIHAGLLPKYRGPASNFWVLFNKEKKTGVTFHYMTEGVDRGDIILQKALEISPHDTEDTLDIRLAKLGSESIVDVVEQIEKGTVRSIPQSEQESSYFPQPQSKHRKLLAKARKNRPLKC